MEIETEMVPPVVGPDVGPVGLDPYSAPPHEHLQRFLSDLELAQRDGCAW